MWLQKLCFICALFVVNSQDFTEDYDVTTEKSNEKKPSEIILALIEHFKQPNPEGLPGELVPDPSPIADAQQYMPLGVTMYFKNSGLYGTSKFHILNITADVQRMEIQGAVHMDKLQTRGNYTMSTWFESKHGVYIVNMTNLNFTTRLTLDTQIDGQLQVQDVNIDVVLDSITTDFNNLGFAGGMFQNVLNSGGNFVFDTIKPYMLEESYTNIRTDLNAKLDNFVGDMQFPNTIPIIDMVIIKVRDKVRDMELDPFRVKDVNQSFSAVSLALFNTWFNGLSTLHRVGNITVKVENYTAVTEFELGTKKLEGKTQWDISALAGIIASDGKASFSVEYMSVKVILVQPLDTRKKPILKNLHLDVGNIQIRSDGFGTIDYVVELIVNILPNMLRYQIIGAVEGPLKERIQQELDEINVEELIKKELPMIDEMQDVKLSDLVRTKLEEENYDEDEFFNF